MKQRLITLFIVIAPIISFSQSINSFFKYEGVKLLAELSHPTNSFKSGEFTITSLGNINVKIFYYDDYYTELYLTKRGDFFTEINTIKDNDPIVSPFFVISVLKNIALELVESDTETASKFEKYMGKKISQMDGSELACLILTLSWFAY